MKVSNVFDIVGGLLTIALVAVIFTKPNTKGVIQASGSAFTGALKQAEAG
jgi:hypothetical protein